MSSVELNNFTEEQKVKTLLLTPLKYLVGSADNDTGEESDESHEGSETITTYDNRPIHELAKEVVTLEMTEDRSIFCKNETEPKTAQYSTSKLQTQACITQPLDANCASFVPNSPKPMRPKSKKEPKKHRKTKKGQPVIMDKICVDTCKYRQSSLALAPTLRCCTCMQWHHFVCVNEDPDTGGLWNCFKCRKVLSSVLNCLENLDKVNNEMGSIKNSLQGVTEELISLKKINVELLDQLSKKQQQCERVLLENASLKAQLNKAKNESNVGATLLIRNSLVRNMAPTPGSNLQVKCLGGAKLSDIQEHLSKETSHYGKITIQAGINDCRNNETTPEETVNKYQDVIQEAGKHCEHVTISSIIPCTKSKLVAEKKDTTNIFLAHACSETSNVSYIDNNGTFKLADGLMTCLVS